MFKIFKKYRLRDQDAKQYLMASGCHKFQSLKNIFLEL